MKQTDGRKAKEWAAAVQGVVCLLAILYGMSLSLESVLEIQIPWQARLAAVVILAAGAQLVRRGWMWALAEILAVVGVLLAYALRYQETFHAGMRELANSILGLVNEYHRTEYLLWYLDKQEGYGWTALLIVFVLLGSSECLIFMRVRNRRRYLPLAAALPALVISAGLMVGWAASFAGILLSFAGLLLGVFDVREKGNILLASVAAAGIGIPMLLVNSEGLWQRVGSLHEAWYPWQIAFEDQMIFLAGQISHSSLFSSEGLKQYSLKNEEPKYSGKEIFKITADYPISMPLYIRGFAGGAYEDGTWKRISRQEFSDWAQGQGGDEQTYARLVQSFPFEFLEYMPEIYFGVGKKKHVTLELSQELKGHSLMPYFTRLPEEQEVKADGVFLPGKELQYEWESYLGLVDYDLSIVNGIVMEALLETIASGNSEIMRKNRVFMDYSEYVQEEYTRLPEEGLEKLRVHVEQYRKEHLPYDQMQEAIMKKLKANGQDSWELEEMQRLLTEEEFRALFLSDTEYTAQTIQQLLWDGNWYSFDLEEVPEGEDSVEFFLLKQHKGYCTHFASAATLIYRLYGVPARYASGYLVMPSDFKKNQDRTWTASVTDERAHAWTEVFHQNIGFVPVEATPPDYEETLADMEEGEGLVQAVRKKEAEEHKSRQEAKGGKQKKEEEQEKEEAGDKKEEPGKKEEQEKKDGQQAGSGSAATEKAIGRICRALAPAVMAVTVVALISFFLWRRRIHVLKERQRRFSDEDSAFAVCEIDREIGNILCLMGKKRRPEMDDAQYQAFLEQELPNKIGWAEVFSIIQKAKFSEHGVTEGEYKEILSSYQTLEKELAGVGGVRGWYLRYIKIYS